VREGMSVIDIGGSLAGFQFTLAKAGAKVTNIDPGQEASGLGWPVDQESIARLNRSFGTDVRLLNMTLEAARLEDETLDTAYSISTIEHIPPGELPSTMREIARVLKPGGHCVLTVDLFLNLHPFSDREANEWGTNIPPRMLVEESGLDLVAGRRDQLLGYPEFEPKKILADLDHYLIGSYPTLTQCLVLRKNL
jgi:SAM-dependent methyltransferase